MDKTERLNLIRNAALRRPRLTGKGAEFLEELHKEEPDLPGVDVAGVLPPERIEREDTVTIEDESELNTETISPLMRLATTGHKERALDAVQGEDPIALSA